MRYDYDAMQKARLKLAASRVGGLEPVLDLGHAVRPNEFLDGEVWGADIIDVKPESYVGNKVVNLNKDFLPFPNGYFRAAVACEVLEHLENPYHCLREVNRVLVDGGRLVVSVPNPYHWREALVSVLWRKYVKNKRHLATFNMKIIETLLYYTGFQVLDYEGCFLHVPKVAYVKLPFSHLTGEVLVEALKVGLPVNEVDTPLGVVGVYD